MLNENIATVQKFYDALNGDDVPAVMALMHPQILRVEFEGSPSAGTFRGLEEMEAHVRRGRGTWAEGACHPEKFRAVGNKVVVFVHVRVRLKDKTEWIEGQVADTYLLSDGKIIEMRSFFKSEDALAWAGLGV